MPPFHQHTWSPVQKFVFRFFFAFFLLNIIPFPLAYLPFLSFLSHWYAAVWHAVVPWAGARILHLPPITNFTNGSGDTTYDYVLLLVYFVISIAAALLWTLADRKRAGYDALHYWLRALLRFYVASMMFSYGMSKVFHVQMPFPFLSQLVQPFGDKSPMGLAWSYIGYSKAFSAFTGWGEVTAGLFLLFRRTTTLGALLTAVVMANVVAINFCFDVPVKIFSSLLLLMSFFLLAPDAKRLANLLVLNRPVEARVYHSFLEKRWLRITATVVKYVFAAFIILSAVDNAMTGSRQYGDKRVLPPLYGIYNTEIVIRNHDTIPPLTTDDSRWKRFIVQFNDYAQVTYMNDSTNYLALKVDTIAKTATVYSYSDTTSKSKLSYRLDSAYLTMQGVMDRDSVYFRFRKQDASSFRLVNRGFHWINEYPYNR